MIKSTESSCEYVVFDSIEYICDRCNKTLKVTSMDDLRYFENIFDVEAGCEDELFCWNCSDNKLNKVIRKEEYL